MMEADPHLLPITEMLLCFWARSNKMVSSVLNCSVLAKTCTIKGLLIISKHRSRKAFSREFAKYLENFSRSCKTAEYLVQEKKSRNF